MLRGHRIESTEKLRTECCPGKGVRTLPVLGFRKVVAQELTVLKREGTLGRQRRRFPGIGRENKKGDGPLRLVTLSDHVDS